MIADKLFSKRGTLTSSDAIELFGGQPSSTGVRIGPDNALGIPAVYAAVRVIAESIRSMPLKVLREVDGFSSPARDTRLWELLHDRPNPELDSRALWELVTGHMALRGNAYLVKERNRAGQVVALWPVNPALVQVGRARVGGRLIKVYEVSRTENDPQPSGGGSNDVIHFRAFGTDPLVGLSPIGLLRELFGRASAEEQYQGHMLANNARPSGILTTENRLDDERAKLLAKRWAAANAGLANAGKTAVLEDGLTWQQTSLSVADQQFMAQRQMTRQEVALAYRLPPDMMLVSEGGTLHYTSNESNGIRFLTYTLLPWMTRIEGALVADGDLPWSFTGPTPGELYPKFNADAFLRVDTKTRYEAYELAIRAGWLTANEVRELEGKQAMVGGDELRPGPVPNTNGAAQASRQELEEIIGRT